MGKHRGIAPSMTRTGRWRMLPPADDRSDRTRVGVNGFGERRTGPLWASPTPETGAVPSAE